MLGRFVTWLFGSYDVKMNGSTAPLATLVMKKFPEVECTERCDCGLACRVPAFSYRRFKRRAEAMSLSYEAIRCGGVDYLVRRLLKTRPGILVGVLLFFAMIYLSSGVVWEISYDGEEVEHFDVVSERLADMGLTLGAFTPTLDFDGMCNRYLVEYRDLMWLSVNLYGNTAVVEYRTRLSPERESAGGPSNLVAKCDGQIVYFNVSSGEAVTAINDTVVEGDVIVSGIVEHSDGSVELRRSVGEVFAYTRKEVEVFTAFESVRNVVGENTFTKRILSVFGRNIKLYINEMNFEEKYDKIIEEKYLTLPSGRRLPISLKTASYVERVSERFTLSDSDALTLTERKLGEAVAAVTEDAVLLSRSDTTVVREDGVLMTSEVYCLENIAVEKSIVK